MAALQDKIAVVTAAAGAGIGGAIARRFKADGATVVVSDSHADRLARLMAEGFEGEPVDVTEREAVERHVARVLESHGRIDVLVNCAGTNVIKPVWELLDEDWRHILEVNLIAAARMSRLVLPAMIARRSGTIVNIASISAWTPEVNESAYSVSKAALVALTRALAKDLAIHGVRVNAIAPSMVENPFMERLYGKERVQATLQATPLGRGVQPAEVASLASFLASDDSSYVTGETVVIAGGSFFR